MAKQASESKLDETTDAKLLSVLDLLDNLSVDPLQIWYGTGGWLPGPIKLLLWREKLMAKLDLNVKLEPSVQILSDLIEKDPSINKLANQMMEQAGSLHTIFSMSIQKFLVGINTIIKTPIIWTPAGLIGIPLAAWFSGVDATLAGQTLFRYPEWNVCIKGILDAWNKFLNTQESWPTKDNCMCFFFNLPPACYFTFLDIYNTYKCQHG